MSTELGTELPRRGLLVWGCVAGAVFFAWPTLLALRAATSVEGAGPAAGAWALALGMLLLVVVLPLLAARFLSRLRVVVSEDAVSALLGDRVRTRLRFADVTSVSVGQSGGLGLGSNTSLTLTGTDPQGAPATVVASRALVTSLRPLLERTAREVGRRPGILAADQRADFERALAEPT